MWCLSRLANGGRRGNPEKWRVVSCERLVDVDEGETLSSCTRRRTISLVGMYGAEGCLSLLRGGCRGHRVTDTDKHRWRSTLVPSGRRQFRAAPSELTPRKEPRVQLNRLFPRVQPVHPWPGSVWLPNMVDSASINLIVVELRRLPSFQILCCLSTAPARSGCVVVFCVLFITSIGPDGAFRKDFSIFDLPQFQSLPHPPLVVGPLPAHSTPPVYTQVRIRLPVHKVRSPSDPLRRPLPHSLPRAHPSPIH